MNKANPKKSEEYIDINNIPDNIASPNYINIKLSDIQASNCYTLYKYVPVKDIDILITKAHRLDEPWKKIEEIKPLSYYTDKKNTEERTILSNIINSTAKEQIDIIEQEQKAYLKAIPNSIKYHKDYLWQIYYIEKTNRYIMLVATEEYEQQAFIYLLMKKIKGNKGKIYVPICNLKYEKSFINETKINQLENKIYSIINYWPTIYETADAKGKIKISIIGKINIYANILSDYKLEFIDEEQLNDFIELINKLYYIQTELTNYYNFDKYIDKNGALHFYYDNLELTTDKLEDFYKEEIKRKSKSIKEVDEIQIGLTKKVKELKKQEEQLNAELMFKQKQISTFLECKKTFFGKVKYYFKLKKSNFTFKQKAEEHNENIDQKTKKANDITTYNNNIEDLVYICKQLNSKTILAATTRMDMQNIIIKIDILKKKIENANSYIKEIESHKKSIFEFWKYTNKDEKAQLTQAENENKTKTNITEKTFDINNDLKFFAKNIDKKQRKNLNTNECNSVLLGKTFILEDINNLIKQDKITSENFEKIIKDNKKPYIYENRIEHREKAKDINNILSISKESTFDEYKENLKKCIKHLENAFKKSKTEYNIIAYSLEMPKNEITKLELNPKTIIPENEDDVCLFKINLNKDLNIIAFSNIIFFENRNKTLPDGMDYSTEILVDLREKNIIKTKETANHIVDLNTNKIKELNITEFNI